MSTATSSYSPDLLVGDPARSWIQEQGWNVNEDGLFHLAADRLRNEAFSVSRIWHSKASLERAEGSSSESESVLILIWMDGQGAVNLSDRRWSTSPRQMVIAPSTAPIQLDYQEASARLEIRMKRSRLGTTQLLLGRNIEAVPVEERYWRTLATLIVTIFSTGVQAEDPGFPPLQAAIENAVMAAIAQSPQYTDPVAGSYASLLGRARNIIEERFEHPSFSAGELARELSISSAHLHRIFGVASMTPFQSIQQRRVSRALDLMRSGTLSDASIAAQSGFGSSRAMRRALARHAPTATPADNQPDDGAHSSW